MENPLRERLRVLAMIETGARAGELRALTLGDFDLVSKDGDAAREGLEAQARSAREPSNRNTPRSHMNRRAKATSGFEPLEPSARAETPSSSGRSSFGCPSVSQMSLET
jgi:integrase